MFAEQEAFVAARQAQIARTQGAGQLPGDRQGRVAENSPFSIRGRSQRPGRGRNAALYLSAAAADGRRIAAQRGHEAASAQQSGPAVGGAELVAVKGNLLPFPFLSVHSLVRSLARSPTSSCFAEASTILLSQRRWKRNSLPFTRNTSTHQTNFLLITKKQQSNTERIKRCISAWPFVFESFSSH